MISSIIRAEAVFPVEFTVTITLRSMSCFSSRESCIVPVKLAMSCKPAMSFQQNNDQTKTTDPHAKQLNPKQEQKKIAVSFISRQLLFSQRL
jgi:hypothetical protein